jgi:hypothetical protein
VAEEYWLHQASCDAQGDQGQGFAVVYLGFLRKLGFTQGIKVFECAEKYHQDADTRPNASRRPCQS